MIDCKNTIDTLREIAAEVIGARFTGHQKDEALESAHGWLIAASVMLEEVERERDAAVKDINESQPCFACKHYHENNGNCRGAKICRTYEFLFEAGNERYHGPSWEWRGPCAENGGTEDV